MEKKEGAPAPGDTVVTCDKPRSRSIGTHRRVHVHVHVSCRYVPDAAGHDGHPHLGHDTDHIVPDFDDPDIPARVWDAYLRDGKITQEERERVAQHAAETGRAGKRTRDDIDTAGWGSGGGQGLPWVGQVAQVGSARATAMTPAGQTRRVK